MTNESFDNLTPRSRQVLVLARQEADHFNHNFVGTEHVLLGLLALGQGVAVTVLEKLGLNLENVRQEVEKQVGIGPDQRAGGDCPYTPRVRKAIKLAQQERQQLNHTYLGTEHLLLGLLREGGGVAAKIIRAHDIDLEQLRIEILRELDPNLSSRPGDKISKSEPEEPVPHQPRIKTNPLSKLEPIDLTKRYDVYCIHHGQTVVYRNVLFKGTKILRNDTDVISAAYFELELPEGKSVFLIKHAVFKFADSGAAADGEKLPPKT